MVQQAPNTFMEGWLIDASADKRVWRILTSERGKSDRRLCRRGVCGSLLCAGP